jgi:hypothetical protein
MAALIVMNALDIAAVDWNHNAIDISPSIASQPDDQTRDYCRMNPL